MKRILVACAAVGFGVVGVFAASPEVEKAIKSIQSATADTAKAKTFCDLYKTQNSAGDKEDAATEKKIDELSSQLGDDFEAAWAVGGKLDENSADGKEFYAAVDEVAEKCED